MGLMRKTGRALRALARPIRHNARRLALWARDRGLSALGLQHLQHLAANARHAALACARLRYRLENGCDWPDRTAQPAPRRLGLAGCLCRQQDFMTPEFSYWMRQMQTTPAFHRKLWEYFWIAQTLWEHGMLESNRAGLGFGVGVEPLPALFAKLGATITATDVPSGQVAQGWRQSGAYGGEKELLNQAGICDPTVFSENVSFRPVDMNSLAPDLGAFDFLWSACALEHLGSIEAGLNFVVRSSALLLPGGVAVHTTEFNLSDSARTLTHGPNVILRSSDLDRLAERLAGLGCRMLPVNLDPGSAELDAFIDLPPYPNRGSEPHLRLLIGDYVATSVGMVVAKD